MLYARASRRRTQALEAQLRAARRTVDIGTPSLAEAIAAQAAQKDALAKSYKALRKENAELRDEIEEVKAMVEVLKAQVTGTPGLVYPRKPDES